MKGMPIRNGYYVLAQQLRGEIIRLLAYPLTPVPYNVAIADDFLNKADKSKGYHFLTKYVEDVPPPSDDKTLVIEDGNAAFHYLKDFPPNFRDICARMFDMVVRTNSLKFARNPQFVQEHFGIGVTFVMS
jgi:hypothetical protein